MIFTVPEDLEGLRADSGLAKISGLSRAKITEAINSGGVIVDGKACEKAQKLKTGQLVEINLAEQKPLELIPIEDDRLKIVYQDESIVVIDKPAGVVSHPTVGFEGPSVPEILLSKGIELTTSGASERQGIVQRLDVGTSGLMTLAKTENSYSVLKQMFRDREVKKTYHAIVQGHLDPSSGTIDSPIARSTKHDYKFRVAADGKPSITHYDTLEVFPGATLISVGLETGRTHQIRVHFDAFRHPLVGDDLYGANPKIASKLGLKRQWLHSTKLQFKHPTTGEQVSFESEYPEDLANALSILRSSGISFD
ncbi:MAG TPA: RluA family pseudouridine synthase [Microbacteriaceae bacterium]